jgi:hypothetical protein
MAQPATALIVARLQAGTDANQTSMLRGLTCKVAIADARLTCGR